MIILTVDRFLNFFLNVFERLGPLFFSPLFSVPSMIFFIIVAVCFIKFLISGVRE